MPIRSSVPAPIRRLSHRGDRVAVEGDVGLGAAHATVASARTGPRAPAERHFERSGALLIPDQQVRDAEREVVHRPGGEQPRVIIPTRPG